MVSFVFTVCPDHCSSCEYEQDGDSGSLLCTGCDSGYSLHTASNEGSCISKFYLNPYSAGIDFSRQNLTSVDVRF